MNKFKDKKEGVSRLASVLGSLTEIIWYRTMSKIKN